MAGKASAEELDQLVKEADLGGREPAGAVSVGLAILAAAWSLFQVWYASPLPFVFGFGILNDTEARAIHLAFEVFLAFCAFPGKIMRKEQRINLRLSDSPKLHQALVGVRRKPVLSNCIAFYQVEAK